MSSFDVVFQVIKEVKPIPGADLIEAATLDGLDFWFVVKKSAFKPGQQCVYFPVDSIIPVELLKKLGLEGRLAGHDKNRVKTVKLRGQISQGIVASPADLGIPDAPARSLMTELGVTKYEPPEQFDKTCRLISLPDGLSKYDIESVDRYPQIALSLFDPLVQSSVTEKIEGTNFALVVEESKCRVCTRAHEVIELEGYEHTFWRVARRGLLDLGKAIRAKVGQDVVLYGELIGPKIQGNIYKLSEHKVLLYDVKVRYGQYLDVPVFQEFVPVEYRVPELFEGSLLTWVGAADPRILKVMSDGESRLAAGVAREGIVIKPVFEALDSTIGRMILKQRGPQYLAKEK